MDRHLQLHDGRPTEHSAGTDQSQTGNNLDRADYTGPANLFGKVPPSSERGGCTGVKHCLPWLNPSLFAKPSAGSYGDAGKSTFRGPNLSDVDSGLIKNFNPIPSHERFNFQFRAEFFNLFNHPQWSDPNVTFANGAFASTRSTIGTATGNVGTTADSRIIQLALKMSF